VKSIDQAVEAVDALAALDRSLCRRCFEERFNTARMANNYVSVYKALVEEAVSSSGGEATRATAIPIGVPAQVAQEEPQRSAWLDQPHENGGALSTGAHSTIFLKSIPRGLPPCQISIRA
jgi:hypothetical protein